MPKDNSKIKSRLIRCPSCSTSTPYDETNPYRPFCSERCRIIDAGAWASEDYRVAGAPLSEQDLEGHDFENEDEL